MQLIEGRWVAKSLDGKVRRFKELADAEHWRKNHSRQITPAKELSFKDYLDELDAIAAEAEAARHQSKPSAADIWRKFQTAVGDAFPDGDPIDRIAGWLNQHGLTMHDVDAAVKEYSGADSASDYMSQMWDDRAADAEYDAMHGSHGDTYDGEWFQRPNPYK